MTELKILYSNQLLISVKKLLRYVFRLIIRKNDTLHCMDYDILVCLHKEYCLMHCPVAWPGTKTHCIHLRVEELSHAEHSTVVASFHLLVTAMRTSNSYISDTGTYVLVYCAKH